MSLLDWLEEDSPPTKVEAPPKTGRVSTATFWDCEDCGARHQFPCVQPDAVRYDATFMKCRCGGWLRKVREKRTDG